jgi:hypothetical protein
MFDRSNLEVDLLECQCECGFPAIGACPEFYQGTAVGNGSGVFHPQFA